MQNQSFQFILDGVPYSVKATPFKYNEGTRFTVTINGSEYIFAYDDKVSQYVAIDNDSSTLSQNVETEVGLRLQGLPV